MCQLIEQNKRQWASFNWGPCGESSKAAKRGRFGPQLWPQVTWQLASLQILPSTSWLNNFGRLPNKIQLSLCLKLQRHIMEEMDMAGKEESLEGILDEAEEEVEHMR